MGPIVDGEDVVVNAGTWSSRDERGGFYWCRKHERVESEQHCGASQILGPYPTEAAARDHAGIAAARNEAWDDADDAWDRWDADHDDG